MLRWTSLRSGRALTTALAAAFLLSGCSLLLPFDLEQLPCDSEGGCRQGYFCNDANVCEQEIDLPCSPACGLFETCERGTCRPTCAGRACAPGETCDENNGATCRPVNTQGNLGSPCQSHNDCRLFRQDTFCLKPWGGSESSATGVCTRHCDPDETGQCGGRQECITFDGGEREMSLCVDPSFMPCRAESDCTASGMTCGVYVALNSASSSATTSVSACRVPTEGNVVGTPSCGGPDSCVSDLCIQAFGGGHVCTTPCVATDDYCDESIGDSFCLPVRLDESMVDGQPTVRATVCVPGKPSILQSCSSNAMCNADAPYCLTLPDAANQKRCTTPCVNNRCPSGTVCKETPEGSDIPWPQYCGMP